MGTFLPDMSMNAPRGIMLRFDAEGAEAGIEFKALRGRRRAWIVQLLFFSVPHPHSW